MTTRPKRLIAATIISVLLILALLQLAKFDVAIVQSIDPTWLVLMLLTHTLMVGARGIMMCSLAPRHLRKNLPAWVQLSARHQLFFSIFPSGLGDLSFPHLAAKTVQMDAGDAIRVITQFRLRDAVVLAIMALSGLLLISTDSGGEIILLVPLLLGLWFSDEIAIGGLRIVRKLIPSKALMNLIDAGIDHQDISMKDKAMRTLLVALVWFLSVASVLLAFKSMGLSLSIGEAFLLIASINAAGMISLTIAGLGVAEAGAATALLITGRSLHEAAALALVVRPILLFSVISACAILNVVFSLFRRDAVSRQ